MKVSDPFAEFVLAARPVILAALRRYGQRLVPEDKEDVTQDIYISLYRVWKSGKFLTITYPDSYIYTLAKNHCLALATKIGTSAYHETGEEGLLEVSEEQSGLSYEEKDTLMEAVRQLPERYREVIYHVLQGYSLVELSGKWNESANTIKSLYHRAKGQLAKTLLLEKNNG